MITRHHFNLIVPHNQKKCRNVVITPHLYSDYLLIFGIRSSDLSYIPLTTEFFMLTLKEWALHIIISVNIVFPSVTFLNIWPYKININKWEHSTFRVIHCWTLYESNRLCSSIIQTAVRAIWREAVINLRQYFALHFQLKFSFRFLDYRSINLTSHTSYKGKRKCSGRKTLC